MRSGAPTNGSRRSPTAPTRALCWPANSSRPRSHRWKGRRRAPPQRRPSEGAGPLQAHPSYDCSTVPDIPALDAMTFAISTFKAPATTSTTPTRKGVAWGQLTAAFREHRRSGTKDGPGWTPATYKHGTTRANRNAVQWSMFGGDCDHWTADQYI